MNKKSILILAGLLVVLAFFANHAIEKEVVSLTQEITALKADNTRQAEAYQGLESQLEILNRQFEALLEDHDQVLLDNKSIQAAIQIQNDVVKALELEAGQQWRLLQQHQAMLYIYHEALSASGRLESIYGFYSGQQDQVILLDYCEWLGEPEDRERLAALGIEEDTLPNGYYIHDVDDAITGYVLDPNASFFILEGAIGVSVGRETFFEAIEAGTLLYTKVLDGRVMEVHIAYRP